MMSLEIQEVLQALVARATSTSRKIRGLNNSIRKKCTPEFLL
jgi:hypothetical protein